jgi:hypothetical protein
VKIKQTIVITYEPRPEHYDNIEYTPETVYEMAALDRAMFRSGDLLVGEFPEEDVISTWEIISDTPVKIDYNNPSGEVLESIRRDNLETLMGGWPYGEEPPKDG